jgi:hypothetical protein
MAEHDAAAEAAEAEATFAADMDYYGRRHERQWERFLHFRDESLRGPDLSSLEAIGEQRAGHVPYHNADKTAQRNYIAFLQKKNKEDEAAARYGMMYITDDEMQLTFVLP